MFGKIFFCRFAAVLQISILSLSFLPDSPAQSKSPATIYSNTTPITINTTSGVTVPSVASNYPSPITVSGMTGTITKVEVSVKDILFFGDAEDLLLVSPTGAKFIFLSDAYIGNGYEEYFYTFSDTGANFAHHSYSGTYKPKDYVAVADIFPAPAPAPPYDSPANGATFASVFNGANPNGTWNLYAVSDRLTCPGFLRKGWSLTITTDGSPQTFSSPNTLYNNGVNALASPYGSTINVAGQSGVINNVKVSLTGYSHTVPADVDIALVSPNGVGVILMSDIGANFPVTDLNFTFDDAAGDMKGIYPIVSGTYKPSDRSGYNGDPDDFFPAPAPYSAESVRTVELKRFNGSSPNGEWKLFVLDDGQNGAGSISGGWSLEITTLPPPLPTPFSCLIPILRPRNCFAAKAPFDYNGDRQTEYSVVRGGTYYINTLNSVDFAFGTGGATDTFVPADYDGDGRMEGAFFRPQNGLWYVTDYYSIMRRIYSLEMGLPGDIPAPADFDRDGRADLAVFRPGNGTWYIRRSSNNSLQVVQLGANGDKPVAADFDGDGKADQAVFRPSNGTWYILRSGDGQLYIKQFGSSEDKTVVGDYDADGKADIAVWRPSTAVFYVFRSSDNNVRFQQWGLSSDIPVIGDFDGDRKIDYAVWRPINAVWYILKSSDGATIGYQWGLPGDKPVPSAYVR